MNLIADAARMNFALLLTFYLGAYIAKGANTTPDWYDYRGMLHYKSKRCSWDMYSDKSV